MRGPFVEGPFVEDHLLRGPFVARNNACIFFLTARTQSTACKHQNLAAGAFFLISKRQNPAAGTLFWIPKRQNLAAGAFCFDFRASEPGRRNFFLDFQASKASRRRFFFGADSEVLILEENTQATT